jgi:mono/diheme cytochrome c family protein
VTRQAHALSLGAGVLAAALLLAGGPLHAAEAAPEAASASTATATASAQGAALFAQHCAACHQDNGSGTVGLAPALKGPHWTALGERRDYLPTVLLKGMAGLIKVNGQNFVGSMPSFSALGDEQIAALANHLATLQGASQRPAFVAADIAALRGLPGNPVQTQQLRRLIVGP